MQCGENKRAELVSIRGCVVVTCRRPRLTRFQFCRNAGLFLSMCCCKVWRKKRHFVSILLIQHTIYVYWVGLSHRNFYFFFFFFVFSSSYFSSAHSLCFADIQMSQSSPIKIASSPEKKHVNQMNANFLAILFFLTLSVSTQHSCQKNSWFCNYQNWIELIKLSFFFVAFLKIFVTFYCVTIWKWAHVWVNDFLFFPVICIQISRKVFNLPHKLIASCKLVIMWKKRNNVTHVLPNNDESSNTKHHYFLFFFWFTHFHHPWKY